MWCLVGGVTALGVAARPDGASERILTLLFAPAVLFASLVLIPASLVCDFNDEIFQVSMNGIFVWA